MQPIDIVIGVVIGHLTAGASKIALAPFEAVADEWRERVRARIVNTRGRAERKAKGRPIEISERAAYKIFVEAAFNDDSIVAEYLGGVLAASRANDDAGVAVTALIGRLSAVHLRLHYIVYREIRRLWPRGEELPVYHELRARRAAVRIPMADLVAALPELPPGGLNNAIEILRHENLIGAEWSFAPDGNDWAYLVAPSGLGAELFLWGHGIRPAAAWRLVEPGLDLDPLDVPGTPSARLLHDEAGRKRGHAEPTHPDVQAGAPDILTANE